MIQYKTLIKQVIESGFDRNDRTNTGTRSVFGTQLSFICHSTFPIVTTRKINFKAAAGELAAFIRGATTTAEFKALGCNYWDAYGEELGPVYGAQWRNWGGSGIDQLKNLVAGLLTNPSSRRHILSTWNVSDLHKMALPPCHIINQYYTDNRGYLHSLVYMRSVDVILGLPYDVCVYALLLHLVGKATLFEPGTLTFMMGDTHIYHNHLDAAHTILGNEPLQLPTLCFEHEGPYNIFEFIPEDVSLIGYEHCGEIKVPLNV